MSEKDELTQQHGPDPLERRRDRDDRRKPVNPADNPVPQSPEAEHEAVREGEEKLDRVKPY